MVHGYIKKSSFDPNRYSWIGSHYVGESQTKYSLLNFHQSLSRMFDLLQKDLKRHWEQTKTGVDDQIWLQQCFQILFQIKVHLKKYYH